MKRSEAILLLEKLESALAHGRTMIGTIKPIPDFAEDPKTTYEEGKHDGYLEGMYDGIEASMGMVEHFIDTIGIIEGVEIIKD